MSVAKIINCQWYMNEIWARKSGVMKWQGNMKVLGEKPVPALEETQGMNNKLHNYSSTTWWKIWSRNPNNIFGRVFKFLWHGLWRQWSEQTHSTMSLLRPCITSTSHLHRDAQHILHHTKYKISIYSLLIFEL